MRRLILLMVLGLGLAVGCGGPREEVRVYSSVPQATPQQQLDGVAAGFFNRLLGGIF